MPTQEEVLEAKIRQELKNLFRAPTKDEALEIWGDLLIIPFTFWLVGAVAWSIATDIREGICAWVRWRAK